jgi:ABC-type tungstate transport system permease subunit
MHWVEAGYGVNRRSVMVNDFVILGPEMIRQEFEESEM